MRLKQFSLSKSPVLKAALATALVGCMAAPALAQDTTSQQQLPSGFAEEQIPSSFPDLLDGAPAAEAAPVSSQQKALQERAKSVTQSAASAPAENAVEGGDKPANPLQSDVNAKQAQIPADNEIPSQPEAKRLVPSKAMGSEAQSAANGQGGMSAVSGNPAEEPAQSQALPSGLERYTAQTNDLEQEQMDSQDALPQVSNLNMVKLEGVGFDSAASNKVSVAVDGSLQAGKTQQELQEEIRSEAFDAAITGMFPLSPDQIQGLLKKYDATQAAVKAPPYDAPKPEVSVQNVSLDPGVAPPTIKTAVGNVTTLNILDATGAPWPVQDVTWAGDFEIVEPEEGGHIIRITPMSHFARGNIVIRMLTLKTPLTMTLETGRDVVQYRVDARIPEYGPFASAPLMQGGKSMVAGNSEMTTLLDGVASGGMTKLQVVGVDGRTTAYARSGTTYVRTPLTLLSPAWQSSVSSADGMNVYALSNAPVLLLSDGGEFVRATLKEKEDLLDE